MQFLSCQALFRSAGRSFVTAGHCAVVCVPGC